MNWGFYIPDNEGEDYSPFTELLEEAEEEQDEGDEEMEEEEEPEIIESSDEDTEMAQDDQGEAENSGWSNGRNPAGGAWCKEEKSCGTVGANPRVGQGCRFLLGVWIFRPFVIRMWEHWK